MQELANGWARKLMQAADLFLQMPPAPIQLRRHVHAAVKDLARHVLTDSTGNLTAYLDKSLDIICGLGHVEAVKRLNFAFLEVRTRMKQVTFGVNLCACHAKLVKPYFEALFIDKPVNQHPGAHSCSTS